MKKQFVFLLVGLLGLIVIGGGLYFLNRREVQPDELVGDEFILYTYTINGEQTGGGTVSVPFIGDTDKEWLINLLVDLDNDGSFDFGDEWVARNQTARVFADYRNNFTLDLSGSRVSEGEAVNLKVVLSQTEVGDDWAGKVPEAGLSREGAARVERYEMGEILGINVEGARRELKRGPAGSFRSSGAGVVHAQEEPAEAFRKSSMPDLAQGPMECIPVSVANNLISLAQEHGAGEELPGDSRDLIDELKRDMEFDKGVLGRNIVPGKDDFVQRHNLPVSSEMIEYPTVQEIVEAIESGCVVELSMSWIRSESGMPDTGHVVSMKGVTSSNGTPQVQVHDPATPEGLDTYDLPSDAEYGEKKIKLIDYPGWDGIAFIDAIVVQCWTGSQPATTGTRLETSRVEMLVMNNHYFPKSQFYSSRCGECDGAHWHSEGTVYGLKSKTSTEIVSMNDPAPPACGFGKVNQVPAEFIDITLDQSSELIKHVVP